MVTWVCAPTVTMGRYRTQRALQKYVFEGMYQELLMAIESRSELVARLYILVHTPRRHLVVWSKLSTNLHSAPADHTLFTQLHITRPFAMLTGCPLDMLQVIRSLLPAVRRCPCCSCLCNSLRRSWSCCRSVVVLLTICDSLILAFRGWILLLRYLLLDH
jgi:hypothetical protein